MDLGQNGLSAALEEYYAQLPYEIRKSFPKVEDLTTYAAKGYDAHYLAAIDPATKLIAGLVVCNMDTMI